MAGAAALEPGLGGEFADEGNLVFLVQGQDTLVLQQDHALPCNLSGEKVIFFLIPGSFGLGIVQILIVDGQDPLTGQIHILFVQLVGKNSFHDLPVVETAGGGHFQIQTGLHTGHTVGNGTPVGHDVAFEAPLVPEYLGQEPGILGSVDTVDPVVGTHNGPGLGLLYGDLKGGEVDLTKRPLVRVGGGAHTAVLLVVGGEVLDGGTHIFGLDTLDIGGGHFTGEIRILGEILEVSAAQRAALDVDSGA